MKNTILTVLFLGLLLLNSTAKAQTILCTATWYDLHGRTTASGSKMDRNAMTCAYNGYPLGTVLKITRIKTQEEIIVTVTDRLGDKNSKKIDLSYGAFGLLAKHTRGIMKVKIKKIDPKVVE